MNDTSGISQAEPSHDDRLWAMFAHLAALAGYVIPLGNIVGPLVVWLIKKEEMPFVDEQGKESLNFQITMMIAAIVSALLMLVLIGFLLLFAVAIFDIVMVIIASIKANDGEHYQYPLTLRLIK